MLLHSQSSLTSSISEADWVHMGLPMEVEEGTLGVHASYVYQGLLTTPHLGTCPFQFQTGKKNEIWKLGVYSLERCTGCLQGPGEVISYLQGCPSRWQCPGLLP